MRLPPDPRLQPLMAWMPKVLLAIVATGLMAGCGGTDIELGAPSSGVTYPDGADEICAEVAKRFAEAQAESPRSFEQAEELTSSLLDLAGQGEAGLAAIAPPPDAEAEYERYLAARAEVVELLEDGLAAAQDEDGKAYESAREDVGEGAAERERLARVAGLRGCAAAERG